MSNVIMLETMVEHQWIMMAPIIALFLLVAATIYLTRDSRHQPLIATIICILLFGLFVAAVIFLKERYLTTTKQYPAVCKQMDGETYCVLKEGRIDD